MAIDPGAPLTPPIQKTIPATAPDAPAVGTPDPGQVSAVLPSPQPSAPAGSQPNRDPNAVPGTVELHHGALASIFQDLAGGKKTTWRQTENGPVAVKENLAPGEMARGILAAAITGMASGYSPEVRGKGPGAAIDAGFKGNEQRVEKTEQDKQKQAQQQFTNQQSADELTMRKMQNAREQQRSIQEAQEHDMRMDQMKQTLEKGKTEGAQEIVEFQQRQTDRMNLLSQTGVKPLSYPDGKPVEEFNSPAEAMDWANKNSKLAIQPGKYNTIVEVDPHTNRYMIMQKPMSWDDPQWLGVKTKNGVPEKDKNGEYVPDGSFKDMHGKVVAPAGQMTPHQMYDSQMRLIDSQNKELTLQEGLERLKITRMERVKDQQQNKADDEFNRAQGNPDAIDEKTHEFIVSPSSRTILQQRFIKDGAMQASILNAAQKEIERTDPKDPEFEGLQQTAKEARDNLHQIQVNMMMLSRTPNIADVLASNLRQANTKPDGTYDEESAVKSLESMQMNSGVKQTARQKLTAATPDVLSNPDNFNKAIAHAQDQIKQGQSLDAIIGEINQTKAFSQNDKQRLIDELQKKTKPDESVEADTLPGPAGAVQQMIRGAGTKSGPTPDVMGVAMQ